MTQDHADEARGREITRFIPVPKSVSIEAQQFLATDLATLAGGDARAGA